MNYCDWTSRAVSCMVKVDAELVVCIFCCWSWLHLMPFKTGKSCWWKLWIEDLSLFKREQKECRSSKREWSPENSTWTSAINKKRQSRTSVEIPSHLAVSATVLFIVLLGCVCKNYRYVFTELKISRQFKIFTRKCLEQTAILLMLVGLWRA